MTEMRQASSISTQMNIKESILLNQALMPVVGDLALLKPLLKQYLTVDTETSSEIVDHIFSNQGKLVRPALFYLVSKMLGYSGEHLNPIAAVCEYIHTASLLHDDVVDCSQLRRNKPSANSIWGDESSVLVGDLIYSTASELMANTGYLEIVKVFAYSIRQMSEGELLQLEHLFSFDMEQEVYFKILKGKTAILMASICRSAGILAEVTEEHKFALEHFGLYLGIAFQLIDDALDYIGHKSTVGKEVLADVLEGKITLPLILLKEYATDEEKQRLNHILSNSDLIKKELDEIRNLVSKYKTAEKVLKIAEGYTERALAMLMNNFPDTTERKNIEILAKSLVYRMT